MVPSNFVPGSTFDAVNLSANTHMFVPVLDKKKVCVGDWFVLLIHGKDPKPLPPPPPHQKEKRKNPPHTGGSLVSECFHKKGNYSGTCLLTTVRLNRVANISEGNLTRLWHLRNRSLKPPRQELSPD